MNSDYFFDFLCRYSPFLMACFNPETEEFQSVCRVMSGFSDAFYIEVIKISTTLLHFSVYASLMVKTTNFDIVTKGGHSGLWYGFIGFRFLVV